MTCDCGLNFVPLHSNITAEDWEQEIGRVDILQEPSLNRKVEYWIALFGSESRVYFHLRLPDDDDMLAAMEVTTDPQPPRSWEVLAQFDETGRGRCFADAYVLLRQLGFDRWMLKRGTGEPHRHRLRSWTYCIFARLISHAVFRLKIPTSTLQPLKHLWSALFPSGSDLRESTCYCPALDENEVSQRKEEWEGYRSWRQMLDNQRRQENDRTTENVLERLEGQIKVLTKQAHF